MIIGYLDPWGSPIVTLSPKQLTDRGSQILSHTGTKPYYLYPMEPSVQTQNNIEDYALSPKLYVQNLQGRNINSNPEGVQEHPQYESKLDVVLLKGIALSQNPEPINPKTPKA